MSDRKAGLTQSKTPGKAWLLPLVSLTSAAFAIALFVSSVVVAGDSKGIYAWVGGAATGLAAAGALVYFYQLSFRHQLRAIRSHAKRLIVQTAMNSELRDGLSQFDLLPQWRVNCVAIQISAEAITFWNGIRSPFVFATIPASDVRGVAARTSPQLMRTSGTITFTVEIGGVSGELAFTPFRLTSAFVQQYSTHDAADLATQIQSVMSHWDGQHDPPTAE